MKPRVDLLVAKLPPPDKLKSGAREARAEEDDEGDGDMAMAKLSAAKRMIRAFEDKDAKALATALEDFNSVPPADDED